LTIWRGVPLRVTGTVVVVRVHGGFTDRRGKGLSRAQRWLLLWHDDQVTTSKHPIRGGRLLILVSLDIRHLGMASAETVRTLLAPLATAESICQPILHTATGAALPRPRNRPAALHSLAHLGLV
jgi:hypothetical protein